MHENGLYFFHISSIDSAGIQRMTEAKVGTKIKRKALKTFNCPHRIIVALQQLDKLRGSLQKYFPAWLEIIQELCKDPWPGNRHTAQRHTVTAGLIYHSQAVIAVEYIAVAKNRN